MTILAYRMPLLECLLKNRKLITKFNSDSYHQQRNMSYIIQRRLNNNPLFRIHNFQMSRSISIKSVLSSVLKLRYLVGGSAVGSTITLLRKFQEWKDSLPDLSWFEDIKKKINSILDNVKDSNFDSSKTIEKLEKFKDEAYKNAEISDSQTSSELAECIIPNNVTAAVPTSNDLKQTLENLQKQKVEIQLKYEKKLEKLKKENMKKVKVSLIDMYSELLDELNDYDSSYHTQDHLPRVVVIGDQSSGKTSVLEMIAQARIFPRGAGEMMTRSPVKVTLSEGPYHIAQFKDSAREFDLTKESELAELRKEIEIRMKNSVSHGNTVSNEEISMTVRGPGRPRMILVDLPGIISIANQGMAPDTKECIRKMSTLYMSNPNSIILCIQDGSVDAEKSIVTDLVSQIDQLGRRTILVLTKVDLAEKYGANSDRINKILSGSLFPMKALGYFAVVTGKGNKDDSIESIKEYEDKFFRNSKLFRESIGISSQLTTIDNKQLTTRNLSMAVADCFWKMIRETVEQQVDSFKETRYNLEKEWRDNFPRYSELDIDDLLQKARVEILDELGNLLSVSVKDWEDKLSTELWKAISQHIFENIYLPAGYSVNQTNSTAKFKTMVDIKLMQWAEEQLPKISINFGWSVLKDKFKTILKENEKLKASDEMLETLKMAVIDEVLEKHTCQDEALETLQIIQLNSLKDRCIKEKHDWDESAQFLISSLEQNFKAAEESLKEMVGPSNYEKWMYWQSSTSEQAKRYNIKYELENLLHSNPNHNILLSEDEKITIINKLKQKNGTLCELDDIWQTWYLVFRRHYFKTALKNAQTIKNKFYHYKESNGLQSEYYEIELCWSIIHMIKETTNILRKQITDREVERLHQEIKNVVDDYIQSPNMKYKLLTGHRVTLVEELNKVKKIQEKLEDFIEALNKEK